jgi:hypothetical protein
MFLYKDLVYIHAFSSLVDLYIAVMNKTITKNTTHVPFASACMKCFLKNNSPILQCLLRPKITRGQIENIFGRPRKSFLILVKWFNFLFLKTKTNF